GVLRLGARGVAAAGGAQDVGQPGAAPLVGDDLGRQGDARQQPGNLAAGVRVVPPLLLQDVLLRGHQGGVGHGGLPLFEKMASPRGPAPRGGRSPPGPRPPPRPRTPPPPPPGPAPPTPRTAPGSPAR